MADNPLTLTTALGFFYEEKLPMLRAFIATFFPNLFVTQQNQIQVDRFTRGRTRAFYRPLDGASRPLAFTNGKGIMYVPPYIGLKTDVSEDLAGGVTVGSRPNTSQNNQLTRKYAMIQDQQANDIMTEIVLQAMTVMRTGSFTAVTGSGQSVGVFDYSRDASLSFTYDVGVKGGFKWLTELWDALKLFRMPAQNIVCLAGRSFIDAMENDSGYNTYVDQVWYQTTDGLQAGRPFNNSEIIRIVVVIKIPGTSHKVTLLSFDETYDDNGTETPFVPDDEAIMTTMNSPRTAAYAGIFIADEANGTGRTVAGEMVSDRFVNKDPDQLVLRTQSRPLLVPGNINHIARVTGTNF